MNTVLDVLVRARALIEKPENWAQGMNSMEFGLPTCASLAMQQITGVQRVELYGRARQAFCSAINANLICPFNDTSTHAQVLAAFDRAIKTERAKATGGAS